MIHHSGIAFTVTQKLPKGHQKKGFKNTHNTTFRQGIFVTPLHNANLHPVPPILFCHIEGLVTTLYEGHPVQRLLTHIG